MEGLGTLVKLRKLDLGKNKLTRCHGTPAALPAARLSARELFPLARVARPAEPCPRHAHAPPRPRHATPRAHFAAAGLGQLTALSQLSLEDNNISSLHGLSGLVSLMELYLGNNAVASLRETHALKTLPRLIILDLLGNPLVGIEEYRLYTVYNLRKLKACSAAASISLAPARHAR